jgi:alpha-L-fucosidase
MPLRPQLPDLERRALLRYGAAAGVLGAVGALRPSAAADVLAPWWQPARPRPTPAQLAWQQDELALFVHFGINTFTDREWGDGTESPALFTPTALDPRQWARAAKAAGAKAMVLTAKHHDGFCLWPTATTPHSVASSPWAGGQGDVVRLFVDACRAEGLKAGVYCSPWDRNHPAYGDSPRYNAAYRAQLTELLTRYGPMAEVWFDGANGEGPNGKKQVYDWPATWALVRQLQPEAVIFSDAGPDVRWIGNERGVAGETHWSPIRPESVPFPGADGPEVIRALQEGHADGTVWRPGETDVSIRPGWFHHAAEDARVKSVEALVDIYCTSVGRNSKLLLNVPPTRAGVFHDTDVARLAGMRAALDTLFARSVRLVPAAWRLTGARGAAGTWSLDDAVPWRVVELREGIAEGQRVARWRLRTGDGREVAAGTTIGHRQLRRVPSMAASQLVLEVETVEVPRPVTLRVYEGG